MGDAWSMRRYNFRKLGNAAVRIHTIRSSFWNPLLSGLTVSSFHSGCSQSRGFTKSLRAVSRSPSGFLNFIFLSDDQAMPVRNIGTRPGVCFVSSTAWMVRVSNREEIEINLRGFQCDRQSLISLTTEQRIGNGTTRSDWHIVRIHPERMTIRGRIHGEFSQQLIVVP